MFKTMDGVEVYDKHDVDLIKDSIDVTTSQHTTDITQLKTKANSLENSKANTSQVQDLSNSLAADEQRLTGAENNISGHSARITALENNSVDVTEFNQAMNNKADKTYAEQTRQTANNNHADITALQNRATALESDKADKTEIPALVNSAVDGMINNKLATIESDINHIVDNAIDDELEDYDDSNTVDQKIATAIDNIPAGPTAMTTAEATAMINNYF